MKVGMRTPSLKKSFKARTTGKVKKQMKKSVNPLYGKKGMGLVDNPKKAVYNKVYNKTTVDGLKPLKVSSSKKQIRQMIILVKFYHYLNQKLLKISLSIKRNSGLLYLIFLQDFLLLKLFNRYLIKTLSVLLLDSDLPC
ncbi:hypothetical protein P1T45_11015 [Streptococcus parauberis]|uniref:hypothetical protein n=1 Tax=Streptococcus parauberis TaxID=1348 RepID=UPI00280B0F3E|nr:hypothetical protein [Streptococcus parauberis]WEM65082.1 hypothetical protein P1T45_11015 [Streptococcus parauberis]